MSLIKATATRVVSLFSHYTFSLFLFNLILPVLLLLYTLILPFSRPFSKASPSLLIFFLVSSHLEARTSFAGYFYPWTSYVPAKSEYIIQQLSYCQFYLLKTYLNMTNIDPKIPGYLDYFLEMAVVLQHLDVVVHPSVGASFEFLMKYTRLCMQSYYFHKKLRRGLGMRPVARVISKILL